MVTGDEARLLAEMYDALGAIARELDVTLGDLRAIELGLSPAQLAHVIAGMRRNVGRAYDIAAFIRAQGSPV